MSELKQFVAADRFVEAQLWWVASEICWRHPHLRMRELVGDQVGSFVEVVSWPDADQLRIGFSRVGGIRIYGHDGFVVPPPELLEQANAHAIVKRLELEHGIGLPERREPTTRETIGYRAIAWILGAMVNSRYCWTLRGERPDDPSVVHGGPWLDGVLRWPSIAALRERWGTEAAHDALYQSAPAHAWVLMRDLEPVAVFDLYGCAHTERGAVDLLARYREHGSSIGRAAMEALGGALRV